ncbi:MAG: cytochrome c maturation protein CcmE [Acidobacteriaceae bacterium]
MQTKSQSGRIAIAIIVVLAAVAYLAITGVRSNKSYYVTIQELQAMGPKAYTRHLRVAGNVLPGSIHQSGPDANFVLVENSNKLRVDYIGADPPPDTFKDNAQALAIGTFGHDGVFHATELQAKCASKYAPAKTAPGAATQVSSVRKPYKTAVN